MVLKKIKVIRYESWLATLILCFKSNHIICYNLTISFLIFQLTNGTSKHHDLKGEGECGNPNQNDAISENGDHENLEPTTKRRKMNRDSGPPR